MGNWFAKLGLLNCETLTLTLIGLLLVLFFLSQENQKLGGKTFTLLRWHRFCVKVDLCARVYDFVFDVRNGICRKQWVLLLGISHRTRG
jgi:hypothetical protein